MYQPRPVLSYPVLSVGQQPEQTKQYLFTKAHKLPTDEELTVEEVNLSSVTLTAAAFQYGKYCENYNNEFMLCRREEKDPRKCLDEGKLVTSCALEFFRKVKKSCSAELADYSYCLDKSSTNLDPSKCRRTQGVYDQCILDNLGIERPHFGYFSRAKVHHTERPRPPVLGVPEGGEFPNKPDGLPDDFPMSKPAYGNRRFM
ncbi:unnamed protein product [Notodromas monacha]|uniref:NADH dehydrogenase [ubiquinone] 1 alpha subcomplex subunit 8 n=1 Tax=Notodromas monacha TaxID=399045 RepID=A0A7R9BKT7_9CRUS|nr:unnamed protein product [Notodromas monacha]CAG0916224.1 unnamed protein product [Notodromas monacha]